MTLFASRKLFLETIRPILSGQCGQILGVKLEWLAHKANGGAQIETKLSPPLPPAQLRPQPLRSEPPAGRTGKEAARVAHKARTLSPPNGAASSWPLPPPGVPSRPPGLAGGGNLDFISPAGRQELRAEVSPSCFSAARRGQFVSARFGRPAPSTHTREPTKSAPNDADQPAGRPAGRPPNKRPRSAGPLPLGRGQEQTLAQLARCSLALQAGARPCTPALISGLPQISGQDARAACRLSSGSGLAHLGKQ